MSHPVYLLNGEPFLAEEALARVRAEAGTDDLSEINLDPSAAAQEILEALETPSLLGGRRLVVVHDAHGLKKDQVEALEAYLESPSPSSVLVLVADGRTKLSEVVQRTGAAVALEPPRGRRLNGWVLERARAYKLKLDEKAARALLETVGTELRDLDAALRQLATGLGEVARVTETDVRAAFARLADERIYAFTDAVGERRMADAMTTLRRLLDQGEPPLVLFGALSGHVRRMLQIHRLDGSRAVGSRLGMPDWRAQKLLKQARSYREEELLAAMSVLATTDIDMKSGDLPVQEVPLERAVVRIISGS